MNPHLTYHRAQAHTADLLRNAQANASPVQQTTSNADHEPRFTAPATASPEPMLRTSPTPDTH
jgi:hypothetical protein